jgi:RNA recognition motif-containing protein
MVLATAAPGNSVPRPIFVYTDSLQAIVAAGDPRSLPLKDTHMKKLFIGNLPQDATEESVRAMFTEFGTVRSISVASDIFSGKCKGFGFIEMEGHEARAAQAALDGNMVDNSDRSLRVRFDDPKASARGGRKRR